MKQRRIVSDNVEAAVIIGDNLVFEAHAHDEYVISANVIGDELLRLNGKPYVAPEGATTLYNPAEIQSGEGTSYLVSIYLQPQYLEQEFGATQQVDFTNPVVFDQDLHRAMQGLIAPILSGDDQAALEERVIQTLFLPFERLSSRANTRDLTRLLTVPSREDWRVERLMDIFQSDLGTMPSLDHLAAEINMRKPQMLRMFSEATGLPPARWQRQLRLREGRRRLKEGQTVARVSAELGFADQAHFSRHFRAAYGIPPGKFSKLHQHSRATKSN